MTKESLRRLISISKSGFLFQPPELYPEYQALLAEFEAWEPEQEAERVRIIEDALHAEYGTSERWKRAREAMERERDEARRVARELVPLTRTREDLLLGVVLYMMDTYPWLKEN